MMTVNEVERRLRDKLGHSSACHCVSRFQGRYVVTARKCNCYAGREKNRWTQEEIDNAKDIEDLKILFSEITDEKE